VVGNIAHGRFPLLDLIIAAPSPTPSPPQALDFSPNARGKEETYYYQGLTRRHREE